MQFGGKVTKALLERYAQSSHWKDGKFQNLEHTEMNVSLRTIPQLLYKQLFERAGKVPQKPIPVEPFDEKTFLAPSDDTKVIWYGHSAIFLRMNGLNVLIDPMLGPNASPIAPFPTTRFSNNTLKLIDQFPPIDLMLLSHDHYDHLDLDSIQKLKHKTTHYFVALGVKRHLTAWGISEDHITEFDWWDHKEYNNLSITFTPSRHFSGRGLTDRSKSLWGGWVLQSEKENIWFSGDGGYGSHFEEIGAKFGSFDLAFMECGQYNENWHQIHLYPEESVQAALDAGAKVAMPVHWGGFALAMHPWQEPVERFLQAAQAPGLTAFTPQPGKIYSTKQLVSTNWWESLT